MEITRGVHFIPGTIANTYLIIESNGLVLVDTGLPGSLTKILRYLDNLGFEPKHLKHIIITHSDDDHYGCLYSLKKLTPAKIHASPIEANAMAQGRSSRALRLKGVKKLAAKTLRVFIRSHPVGVDCLVEDGQVLPFLGGLQVIATPGHTPGHISLYSPSQGVLFAGDSMRSTGEALLPSSGMNTWDEQEAKISMKKQSRLAARIVCVGHGPVIFEASGKFHLLNGASNGK
jgi:glyoxylase-like metal-dependent hydrolase (beta-lactamase superfamily II)